MNTFVPLVAPARPVVTVQGLECLNCSPITREEVRLAHPYRLSGRGVVIVPEGSIAPFPIRGRYWAARHVKPSPMTLVPHGLQCSGTGGPYREGPSTRCEALARAPSCARLPLEPRNENSLLAGSICENSRNHFPTMTPRLVRERGGGVGGCVWSFCGGGGGGPGWSEGRPPPPPNPSYTN